MEFFDSNSNGNKKKKKKDKILIFLEIKFPPIPVVLASFLIFLEFSCLEFVALFLIPLLLLLLLLETAFFGGILKV